MAGKAIVVTSGKGGVGKTTTSPISAPGWPSWAAGCAWSTPTSGCAISTW